MLMKSPGTRLLRFQAAMSGRRTMPARGISYGQGPYSRLHGWSFAVLLSGSNNGRRLPDTMAPGGPPRRNNSRPSVPNTPRDRPFRRRAEKDRLSAVDSKVGVGSVSHDCRGTQVHQRSTTCTPDQKLASIPSPPVAVDGERCPAVHPGRTLAGSAGRGSPARHRRLWEKIARITCINPNLGNCQFWEARGGRPEQGIFRRSFRPPKVR